MVLDVTMFALGWLLFLFGQIQNSIRSSSNGLDTGWAGIKHWLNIQSVNLMTRLFFSVIFYPTLLAGVFAKMDAPLRATGLPLAAWGMAGIAGYTVNTGLNQIFGFIPWLRVEVGQLAPPSDAAAPTTKEK
jgi:hypothetical protein